jgi:NADH-quinone oxidoreductase subunit G
MSDDKVTIEIDGRSLEASKGAMIIHVADQAGIDIPRFCYHPKLSIAANCRMCLVEVEKAPKPMPACATPVMNGMRVFTASPRALAAQKATMEFLLINHPLDCPICDQGGECELQDLSMGYGASISRFTERKRAVHDKDIGPLVETEMTRCIHCTRCVRFGDEIAGLRELGGTGRGEYLQIGTYVEHAMLSELSGNVIDICPVGALTAKPSRFRGRAWELIQQPAIAPHDSVGSNLSVHTLRNRLVRVVPRSNEAINECWLSDRDRFAYEGVNCSERVQRPQLRVAGELQDREWEDALEATASQLREILAQYGPEEVAFLASPSASLEELYLMQKLARGLGVGNIDHRLRQLDYSDQDDAPLFPWLGCALVELEQLQSALLIGSNVRMEQPLLGHRLRKAAMRGARISFINPRRYDFRFPLSAERIVSGPQLDLELAHVAAAAAELSGVKLPKTFQGVETLQPDDAQRRIAEELLRAERGMVLLGAQALRSPDLAKLRLLGGWLARTTGCVFGVLPEAANAAGGWLAGALPHRGPAGRAVESPGLPGAESLARQLKAYVLMGFDPEYDCADPAAATTALAHAELVVSLTPFHGNAIDEHSDVVLPIASFAETAGTWVNLEGRWQSVPGAVNPPGSGRPAWKVLRVLANLCGVEGFDYLSANAVVEELYAQCRELEPNNDVRLGRRVRPAGATPGSLRRGGDVPIYALDGVVRRAASLQRTPLAEVAALRLHPNTAALGSLDDKQRVKVRQGGFEATLPLVVDESIPEGVAWIAFGLPGTEKLGALGDDIELEAAT